MANEFMLVTAERQIGKVVAGLGTLRQLAAARCQ
jgi:hypothetical protein